MIEWTFRRAVLAVVAGVAALAALGLALHGGSSGQASAATVNPTTGVGSCTLRNWNPSLDPKNAKDLPDGQRPQGYRPDDFNCTGAVFAAPGTEFARFKQPRDFAIVTHNEVWSDQTHTWAPARKVAHAVTHTNPLTPYFPPFTHFVILYRENHTFDDYLGDCATTIAAGCNGQVESTNHISSVPDLHTLAKTYALDDAYSTGTQPPSGPNHWWLFSGQSASSSQQQSYPTAGGTEFDRFLKGATGPSGEGTNACTTQTGSGTGTASYPFVAVGDYYWMLSSGSGFWRNPGTGNPEVMPINRPGTTIPEEIHYNEYACNGQSLSDTTMQDSFESFVTANGLPDYSYIELFNDHPGTYQDIPTNDTDTYNIVNFLMNNSAYKNNTLIIVTEDDTQNGNNGSDHVSNTYRVPLVVIGSPTYVKQHYLSHVAYTTSNVLAAMERVMENNKAGIISPTDSLGLSTFPMTTADQSALGDPLEDFWIQGATPLSATATGSPTNGNAPLAVSFTGSATGGTSPYTYSWNFGDGSAASTSQNPSHTYSAAGTYTATLTVTDAASPAHMATSTVPVTVNAVGNPLAASASGTPTSGQTPLNVAFTGTGTGGTPPYTYSWNFGDGSAAVTQQNPSHTYTTAGTFTATLTVKDSASPAATATSTVSVTASPIAGTAPGAPTGLGATAGNGQIALSWTPPASNGGVNITSYKVYRSTVAGGETLLTTGGCSGLGAVTSCTDTGLTNNTTYFYKVSAVNAIGEGPVSNEASATPANSGGCTSAQLIGNPGFETGTAAPWTASSGVINNSTSEPPHSGSWDAWLDGYGSVHTDTVSQSVTIPAACTSDSLSFWLHVDTAKTGTTAQDTLQVQLLNSSGAVLTTLATYSNLDAGTGYTQKTFDVSAYAGQAVTLKLTGSETGNGQTSFVVDDFALNVAGGGGGGNTISFTNPGPQTTQVNTPASLQMQATDSGSGQTLTYSATGLPKGLNISSSGLISGSPTAAGSSSVTVTAKDGTGASGSTTFTWTVTASQNVVTVTNPGNQTGTVGTAASLQIQATDSGSGQTLTYSASGLPAGLSINSSSGLISGTPTTAGTSSVTVTATDTTGASGSASFSWTVSAGANTVTVTKPANQTGTVGTAASLQISASDSASGQTLTYSASGLPAGLSINSSSGLISGTPTTAGTSSVTVTATDGTGASGSASFTWTVNAAGGCTATQLLKDPGFESGASQTSWTWTSTLSTASQLFNNSSSEPPHSGSYDAWLNGWGQTDTDTLSQAVTIPSTCVNATASFWLHIDTAETSTTTAYDKLTVQILNSSGTVLSTLATYSNLNHNTGYAQHSFSLTPYIGQKITLKFTGSEDSELQTSFVIDDTAINVS